jgi:hypothetical protein
MTYNALYLGGPRHCECESSSTPPSQRVPVYAEAEDFDGQCADEQVTRKLGHYERSDAGETEDTKHYVYHWIPT